MNIESTDLQNSTETAIGYIPGYAQVFLGDCLELYKNIEPKSIDLILTDLPYGTTACKWDTIIPFDKLWEMVNYLLKPNGAFITTASQPFTSALVMSNPKMFKYEIIWKKTRYSGNLNATRMPLKAHENILIFGNNVVMYNPIKTNAPEHLIDKRKNVNPSIVKDGGAYNGSKGFINIRKKDDGTRYPTTIQEFKNPNNNSLHPTQKPIALFEYLLKTYSNENMTIFDPCMGSGTTGVACKNLNRNFIGIEKDESYFKIAEQRINARTLFS
jgi:site-specific DNA-methyltransferase (adenine-specific)